jgi:thymidylate kinase
MLSVALIGPDGAGKSTITQRLQQSPELRLKCMYMGINIEASNFALPTSRLVELLKRFANRRSGASPSQDESPRSSRNGRRGVAGGFWAAARLANRLADEWYRQILSWGYQICGYTVVYDRHFLFDFTLDGVDDHDSFDRRLHRWILTHFYPRPVLTIYLDAPAEVLFARKGEKSIEELERRRQAFMLLGKRTPNFIQLDATQPLDAVHAEVIRQIKQFADRPRHAPAENEAKTQPCKTTQ